MAKKAQRLSAERIRQLARASAERLLEELRAEVTAIERTFPELSGSRRAKTVQRVTKAVRKRAGTMSAAARKAASKRMKKYWAERKRAKRKSR